MINTQDFADLLFQHINDSVTWCRMQQVSKKFNRAGKRKLIQVQSTGDDYEETYTTLPNGVRHGIRRGRDFRGQLLLECCYRDGRKHGQCLRWHKNGQMWDSRGYLNGYENGTSKEWDPSGHLRHECDYLGGQRHGHHKAWYADGQLIFWDNYTYGNLDGLCSSWYSNGKLNTECIYSDGNIRGPNRSWYENGQLCHEYNYLNGYRHGVCKDLNSNGKLLFEANYSYGSLLSAKEWYEDGRLRAQENLPLI